MWSNRWPASQIWPAASSLAEMENNCSNSRCCLNTHTSVSPCYALMVWLCPAGAPLIALTTLLLCPAPTGTVPGSLFQERSFMVLREEPVNARLLCLCLPLTCQVAFAGQRVLGCMNWNSLLAPVPLLGPDILRKYSQRGRSKHTALFLFSSIKVNITGDFSPHCSVSAVWVLHHFPFELISLGS